MTFDLQPTLLGATVELRPLMVGDFEELFDVASDPLIWKQHRVDRVIRQGACSCDYRSGVNR